MEKDKKMTWIDVACLFGLFLTVFLLAQPIGRRWDERTKKKYSGEEGVISYDLDTYYYLRKAKEYTEKGLSSISLMNSRTEDPLITSVYPGADDDMPQLLSVLAALAWFVLNSLGLNVGIYSLALGMCSFLLALFPIPIYLFLRKRVSRLAAIYGALIAPMTVPFLSHSCHGVFDTDALIGLLAVTMILSLFECTVASERKKQIKYGLVSIFAMVLLYFTWTAFFVYVVIAAGTTLAGLLGKRIMKSRIKDSRNGLVGIPLFLLFCMFLLSAILGGKTFFALAKSFVSFGKDSLGTWPSETWQVGELTKTTFSSAKSFWYMFEEVSTDFLSYCGGALTLILLIGTMVLLIVRGVRTIREKALIESENIFLYVAIGSWLIGAFVLCLFGIRYMEFFILPVSLVVPFGFEAIEGWVSKRIEQADGALVICLFAGVLFFCNTVIAFPIFAVVGAGVIFFVGYFLCKTRFKRWISILLFGVFSMVVIEGAILIQIHYKPFFENTVEETMSWVEKNTPEDAVIIDFWSLGYAYQYYANRRTVADGGTYNGEFNYWLGTMLMTDNYKLSAGIARMLQNCGIEASRFAGETLKSNKKGSEVLKEILWKDREDAERYLLSETTMSNEQIRQLLQLTHPENYPEMYFVMNHHTYSCASSMTYYRDWDFINTKGVYGSASSVESVDIPGKGANASCPLADAEGNVIWNARITVSDDCLNGWVVSSSGKAYDCARVLHVKDGSIISDNNVTGDRELLDQYALILIEEQGRVSALLCEKGLPDSLLFELYLFDGKDQEMYEKVYETYLEEESDEPSIMQRRMGTSDTYKTSGCYVSLWKMCFE